jgi:predicted metalloenzyme YecM
MNPNRKIDFKIDFLDHVAIRVKDMEVSARWYEEVLRPFPTFY